MSRPEVDGLNAGYAALLLEQYLDNPSAVPSEWRALFESAPEALARGPARARPTARAPRQRRQRARGCGGTARAGTARLPPAPAPVAAPGLAARPDPELLGGVAASMALVKAFRMHGHLAARLDPLGSEPHGDPALEPERLIPKLTPAAAVPHPRVAPAPLRRGRHARRRAAAAPGDLHRHDRLRDRAHLRPRGARLAAPGDRVRPLPARRSRRRSASACSDG